MKEQHPKKKIKKKKSMSGSTLKQFDLIEFDSSIRSISFCFIFLRQVTIVSWHTVSCALSGEINV